MRIYKGKRDTISTSGTNIEIKEKTYGPANIIQIDGTSIQNRLYKNELLNSGFAGSVSPWTSRASSNATISLDTTTYNSTPSSFKAVYTEGGYCEYKQLYTFINTHKYYVSITARNTSASMDAFAVRVYENSKVKTTLNITISGVNTWKNASVIYTADGTETDIDIYSVMSNGVAGTVYFDSIRLIDLTAQFGAGNEPTHAWCDTNITWGNTWAVDIPNNVFTPINRNLYDINQAFQSTSTGLTVTVTDDVLSMSSENTTGDDYVLTQPIKITPNVTYTLSWKSKRTAGSGDLRILIYGSNTSGGTYSSVQSATVTSPTLNQEYFANISFNTTYKYIKFYIFNFILTTIPLPQTSEYWDITLSENTRAYTKRDALTINTHKKNWFDTEKSSLYYLNTNLVSRDNNQITFSATAGTNKYLSSRIYLPAGTYRLQRKYEVISGTPTTLTGRLYVYDDARLVNYGGITSTNAYADVSFTVPNSDYYSFIMYITTSTPTTDTVTVKFYDIQIESNSSATTWEAYSSTNYNIALTSGVTMASLPNGTKDTLVGNTLTKRVGKITMTSTGDISDAKENSVYLCNKAPSGTLSTKTFTMPTGADECIVYYELETPTTSTITVPEITAYEGFTQITTINTVQPTLYLSYIQDFKFKTNGLGILRDFTTNPIITEALNGEYILEFEYSKLGQNAEYLVEENIIRANGQLFRIAMITKTMNHIKVLARHIAFDLARNFLDDVAPTNKNGGDAIDWLLDNSNFTHDFTAWSDITDQYTARYVRKNIIEALITADNSIIKTWGGELEFDNFTIKLHSARGQDRGLTIRYGKNLNGVEYQLDFSTVATRIVPMGANGLLLPEYSIDSTKVGDYATPIVKKIEFNDIKVDETTTESQAYQQLREAVADLYEQGIDTPKISVKVDFVELSKITEYQAYSNLETAYLGDTIKFIIPDLDLDLTTRIIKTVYDCALKRFVKFELGSVVPNITNSVSSDVEKLTKTIEYLPESILTQAQTEATDLITSALGGFIYKTSNELFIMDTDDPNTAQKVWRWNLNGLGYSSTGINGTFDLAMTMDGKIVADFITTGELDGARIKSGSVTADSITAGAKATLQSELKTTNNLVTINSDGIQVTNATSETSTIIDNDEFAVYNNGVKVLTVNKDTTILKKTNIEEDFTVGHIKQIVRTNGLDIVYVD